MTFLFSIAIRPCLQASVTKTIVDTYRISGRCPVTTAQRSSLLLALKEADRDGSLGAKVVSAYLQVHLNRRNCSRHWLPSPQQT